MYFKTCGYIYSTHKPTSRCSDAEVCKVSHRPSAAPRGGSVTSNLRAVSAAWMAKRIQRRRPNTLIASFIVGACRLPAARIFLVLRTSKCSTATLHRRT